MPERGCPYHPDLPEDFSSWKGAKPAPQEKSTKDNRGGVGGGGAKMNVYFLTKNQNGKVGRKIIPFGCPRPSTSSFSIVSLCSL